MPAVLEAIGNLVVPRYQAKLVLLTTWRLALAVDDRSTPPVVAPEVPGMRVEVLSMLKHGGIERALQADVEALVARGFRYAARIDAGDLAAPQRLTKQSACMEAEPARRAARASCARRSCILR